MEKLQAALAKARKTRQTVTGPAADVRPDPVERPRSTSLDRRWEALEPFEVEDALLQQHRVVSQSVGPAAAPFDVLRTKVLLQMRQNGWRRLAVTSPVPSTGKTTTACNLALGLGRQKDLRAILMDLDLRDPSVHSFFGANARHGIGQLLTGEVSFAEQALRIGDNIACSMARDADPDPTRLLLSDQTTDVIEQVEAEYNPDLMIFDLPSVLVNDETRAFLKNVDCALIIVRANSTQYKQFDVCEREISEHTNVLGTVLNAYTGTKSAISAD